jgi:hypothetical protein
MDHVLRAVGLSCDVVTKKICSSFPFLCRICTQSSLSSCVPRDASRKFQYCILSNGVKSIYHGEHAKSRVQDVVLPSSTFFDSCVLTTIRSPSCALSLFHPHIAKVHVTQRNPIQSPRLHLPPRTFPPGHEATPQPRSNPPEQRGTFHGMVSSLPRLPLQSGIVYKEYTPHAGIGRGRFFGTK